LDFLAEDSFGGAPVMGRYFRVICIAARFLRIANTVTVDYLDRLIAVTQKDPSTFWSSPRVLKSLRNSLDLGNLDPFPIGEFPSYLLSRSVDEDEVKELLKVKPPRRRIVKEVNFSDAYANFSRLTGHVVFEGRLQYEPWAAEAIVAWGKAFKALKASAKRVFTKHVSKVKLKLPRGSEDASWGIGGTLELVVKPRMDSTKVLAIYLTHELGHAFEEGSRVDLFESPWGQPPFVSDYAEHKPNIEDFAESFTSFVLEPGHLKRLAPAKYEALRRLI